MEKKKLKKLRLFYTILILMLVISAFVVPYTLLSSTNLFRGSFLFWIIFALVVIFLNIKITGCWKE